MNTDSQSEFKGRYFLSCDVFARFQGTADNFKYLKTQIYTKVYNIDPVTICKSKKPSGKKQKVLPNTKHRYEKVTTPKSCNNVSKFQQKGIVFEWPQRRRSRHSEELTYCMWLLAQGLYWFYTMSILPTGRVIPIEQPPWNYVAPLRKPDNRDYIIEPDWNSANM